MGLGAVIKALDEGARGAVGVGAACVIIGIIIGTVSLTGLGLTFGYEVLQYVGKGQLYLGGLCVMVMAQSILGMKQNEAAEALKRNEDVENQQKLTQAGHE